MSTHSDNHSDVHGHNSQAVAENLQNLPVTDFLSLVHQQSEHGDDNHDVHMQEDKDVKSEPVQQKSNIFSGMNITWSGKFSYPREELKKKIEEHGGVCLENVSKRVTHVLTTSEVTHTSRIEQAVKYNIPLVDEQYIHDCVQMGTRLDISKYLITVTQPMSQQGPASPSQVAHMMQDPQLAQLQLQQLQAQQQQYDAHAAAAHAAAAAQAAAHAAQAAAHAAQAGDMSAQEMLQQQQAQQLRQALQQMIHSHAQQAQLNNEALDSAVGMDSYVMGLDKQPDFDMSENSKFAIKMYVKGSRSTIFTEHFPDIFYTLTWKHKYDIRIISNKRIFKSDNNKILESLTMSLVLAKTNELPVYDEDKDANKRRRKRQKTTQTPNTKRKQKKPTDTDTITISSLHKASEYEILIRFGINSTFCSKRFNYSAFRLFINYAPPDIPDDYHFTIYSAEFKTFVKKNANIAKYLNSPKALNPTTVIITKETTIRMKSPYAQVLQASTGSSFGGASPSPKKGTRGKRKRNADYEEEAYEQEVDPEAAQQQGEWSQMQDQNNLMNIIYPLLPHMFQQQQQQQVAGHQPYALAAQNNFFNIPKIPEKGLCWYGDPIGMNINGDIFYMAFCKDGVLYKINDFVYLAPEENPGETQDSQITQPGESQLTHTQDLASQMSQMTQMSQMAGQEMSQPTQDNVVQAQPEAVAAEVEQPQILETKLEAPAEQVVEPKQEASSSEHAEGAEHTLESSVKEGEQEQMEEDDDIDIAQATAGAPESYWICKIINLVQTKNEGMKLIGQWFYRWCDVQGFGCNIENYAQKNKTKKQFLLQKEKEVFVSFDLNYNSLNTVRGKCFVKFMDQEAQQKKTKQYLGKPHHYFFQCGFNRLKSEMFELPEQMLKIMKETTNDDDEANNQLLLQQQQAAMLQQQQLAQMPLGQGHMMMGQDPSAMDPNQYAANIVAYQQAAAAAAAAQMQMEEHEAHQAEHV